MNTPASIRSHPIHPMLIVFPIALWIVSLICDVIYHAGSHNTFWKGVAFYLIAGGIIGGALAAVPGFVDYLSITDPRVKRVATIHLALNVIILAMFLFNLGIRYNAAPSAEMSTVYLSIAGLVLLGVSGWLGGTLVYEHQMGVSERREDREIWRRAA
jgi:uncharacterized membrane protein